MIDMIQFNKKLTFNLVCFIQAQILKKKILNEA